MNKVTKGREKGAEAQKRKSSKKRGILENPLGQQKQNKKTKKQKNKKNNRLFLGNTTKVI